MKKVIIAVIVFAACQCFAMWLISDVKSHEQEEQQEMSEVDLEIYDFEYENHDYLIFSEQGKTINVLHDPNCEKCAKISLF